MPGARPLHPQPLPRMAYRCPPVPAGQRARLFSITFMSPTKVLTNDQAKELLDKAVGRLH